MENFYLIWEQLVTSWKFDAGKASWRLFLTQKAECNPIINYTRDTVCLASLRQRRSPSTSLTASLLLSTSARRCSPPNPPPTTALTCVLRCFPCEPTWAGSPFLHRPPTPPMVRMTRSKTFQAYLPSCHRTYSCIHCRAHLANHDELISKSFQGSQGRAYLFNSVVNVGCGPAEERVLLTGLHAVADIYCENCKTTLGWKYEHAFESSQKYKEGKFIIELAHMIKDNGWD
uniref:Yippee domain-containing protein n=1 Tax=Oryzias sinensis TaxID=183150 RepID=A0A8C8DWA2_9TELE